MRHVAAVRRGASVAHRTLGRIGIALVMSALTTSVSFAQSPYVGASLGADITRVDGVAGESSAGSGEALSWALKVGTPVVSHFGVELEFSRPQAISQDNTSQPINYLGALTNVSSALATLPDITFPTFSVRTSQRNTTIATTAWVRQQVSPRFSMQYHGGIAFVRVTREFSYDVPIGYLPALASLLPRSSTTIEYNVGPIVGADARIGMTEHAWLVPGVRFEGLSGGWLVRPMVGLAWEF